MLIRKRDAAFITCSNRPPDRMFSVAPGAHWIPGPGRLKLDHISAHIRQKLPTKGTRNSLTELDYPHIGQWPTSIREGCSIHFKAFLSIILPIWLSHPKCPRQPVPSSKARMNLTDFASVRVQKNHIFCKIFGQILTSPREEVTVVTPDFQRSRQKALRMEQHLKQSLRALFR